MADLRVIRKESLPTLLNGSQAPVWWAVMLLVVIETTVFATFLSAYLFLRFRSPEWPPAGVDAPQLLLPIINTIVLAIGSIAVFIGGRALKKGNIRGLKIWLGAGVLLETVFLSVKVYETTLFDYTISTHAYGSIFWIISGLHSVHVIIAIIVAGTTEVLALKDYFTQERQLGVQLASIYWQFVAVIWIPVFVVLYLVPRWS